MLLNSPPTARSMRMNSIERQNVITHDCATFNRNNITNGINFVNVRDETLSSDMHDSVLSTGILVSCLNGSARGENSHDNRNSCTCYYNWKLMFTPYPWSEWKTTEAKNNVYFLFLLFSLFSIKVTFLVYHSIFNLYFSFSHSISQNIAALGC